MRLLSRDGLRTASARVDEDALMLELTRADFDARTMIHAHHHRRKVHEAFQRSVVHVLAVLVAVKRAVDVRLCDERRQ